MKRPHPPIAAPAPTGSADQTRRTAFRFGFSAVIASFVVLGLLILGAAFQEEYEEGFLRLVGYAVRLATPEELAEAEAAGSPPPPLPVTRPDTPVAASGRWLLDEDALRVGETNLPPSPDTLIPIEDLLVETPNGLELVLPENSAGEAEAPAQESANPE